MQFCDSTSNQVEALERPMAHREPEPQSHRARTVAVGTAAVVLILTAVAVYLLFR
jgi:hypothetical protein